MKAVAVFDEPKRCRECPCYNGTVCALTHTQIGFVRATLHKDGGCPLLAFPAKRKSAVEWLNGLKTHELTDLDKGWNECVDYLEAGND